MFSTKFTITLLILFVVAGLTVMASTSQASDLANTKIAFESNRDGNRDLYMMNQDGTNLIQLTNGGINESNEVPSWSPDGTKIAFESNRDGNFEIYVMDQDGANQTRLTNNTTGDHDPSWSPDGTKIAFRALRDGNAEVYVMNADGTGQVNRSNNPAGSDYLPSWSPDGTKIAFVSTRDLNYEIYMMNADGTNQTRLTNNPASDFSPFWSPDGTKIAFNSDRDGDFEVYVMNADGTGTPTQLTFNDVAADWYSSWSPDGTKIVFVSSRNDNQNEVYVMNADGTNQTRLTNNPAFDAYPSWSPLYVPIDIKPGSYPNSINLKSKGVIPVAILSSDDFDATTVVSSTVRFGPARATPVHGSEHIEDVNGDSRLDWVGHFNTQETGLSASDTQASILGRTPGSFFGGTDSVQIVQPKAAPALGALTFSLGQNFRNPFNPDTWIPYTLARDVDVVVEIYDASGRLVRTLNLGQKRAGAYLTKDTAAYWDGKNGLGQTVASGVYFYTLKAGGFKATRKMFVLK